MVLASCTAAIPSQPSPAPDTPRTQIDAMLRDRAAALNEGDIDAFLAPLALKYVDLERQIVEGAATMPITSYDIVLHPGQEAISENELRGTHMSLLYLYEDLPPDNQFRITFEYDFTFQDGSWMITRSVPVEGLALPPWVIGPTLFTRSDHFLVLFRPEVTGIQDIVGLAEQAWDSMSGLPIEIDDVMLITLANSPAQYADFTSTSLGASSVAQAETIFEIAPQRIRSISRSIVENLPRFRGAADGAETLRHEIVHIALSTLTLPFTPSWVAESAAMHFAEQRPTSTWRRGIRENRFNALTFAELGTRASLGAHDASGLTASFEYAYAGAAANYLIETFGVEAYLEFYSSYSKVPAQEVYDRLPDEGVEPRRSPKLLELGAETTRMALLTSFGLTEGALDVAVRDWIREQI